MNLNQYTIKSQEVIQQAAAIAQGNMQQAVETGHILKALLEEDINTSTFIIKKLEANQSSLIQKLDNIVTSYPKVSGGFSSLFKQRCQPCFTKSNYLFKEFWR